MRGGLSLCRFRGVNNNTQTYSTFEPVRASSGMGFGKAFAAGKRYEDNHATLERGKRSRVVPVEQCNNLCLAVPRQL